jgi:hypothetical protein
MEMGAAGSELLQRDRVGEDVDSDELLSPVFAQSMRAAKCTSALVLLYGVQTTNVRSVKQSAQHTCAEVRLHCATR